MNLPINMNSLRAFQMSYIVCFRSIKEILFRFTIIPRHEVISKNTLYNTNLLKSCPNLYCRFEVPWWAPGPYSQSLVNIFKPYKYTTPYRRELISMRCGVHVALDWREHKNMDATTPIVFCLHGMGGDSSSPYMQHVTNAAFIKGFRSVIYNRRGHGKVSLKPKSPNTTNNAKVFPRHCNMDDMHDVMNHITKLYPHAPIYMIGFSAGANLLIRSLAVPDISKHIIGATSVSNGYNIELGTELLKKDYVANGIACQFLKDLLYDGRLDESRKIAEDLNIKIDWQNVLKSKGLQEIEQHLVLPAYGFDNLKEYYNQDSCHTYFASIKTPLLCLSNMNDPFVNNDLIDIARSAAKTNENVITVVTQYGGHIGWHSSLYKDAWWITSTFEHMSYTLNKLQSHRL